MEWINPGDKISLIIEKHRLNVRYKNDSVFVINKISYVDVCDFFFTYVLIYLYRELEALKQTFIALLDHPLR